MIDFAALKTANAQRWANARLTRDFSSAAERLVAAKARVRYQKVAAKTGVPWHVIAAIHERECSQDWSCSLAQGDPWCKPSVHVPIGRGPFKSWEDAATDALVNCPPYAARNTDWSVGGTLTKLEEYNGLGYAARGKPSPYVWSGTDQYRSGKFVRDGIYDPNAVDNQLGCAGLLRAMMILDPTVEFGKSPPVSLPTMPSLRSRTTEPTIANPATGSIGAFIANLISSIFKRR